jgi:peptidoglycan/LPS O-acetylase OafA/YrhL
LLLYYYLLYFYIVYKLKFINKDNFIVKAVAWVGVYSYAMYVFQFVMMRVVEAVLKKLQITHIPPVLDLFIKYAGAMLLAVLLTKLIESPMLILREKIYPSYSTQKES